MRKPCRPIWGIIVFFIAWSLIANSFASDSKIIFLHHSTGENLCEEGRVNEWFNRYNMDHKTEFQFITRGYPGLKPEPMTNYPYDYWKLWVNDTCDQSSSQDRPCLGQLTKDFDVIIFKHCYPASDIEKDTGFPNVTSNLKTIENYKLQYRALRNIMDSYPDTIFIIWTLVPRNRVATTSKNAARAKEFVEWVKNDFLSENGKIHPNIFIFDFWGLAAEQSSNPENGEINCLKWEYERNHGERNSHPNEMANLIIAPKFAEFIVNSIHSFKK